jgi:hypothetical protein
MGRKRERLLAIAASRVGVGARPLTEFQSKRWLDGIRAKRSRSTGVWKWGCRVYVPCPPGVKAATCAAARLANLSEAEFALRVLRAALADARWLRMALREVGSSSVGRETE